jgi:nitrite reductase/ring-hydroxylating ferredoxin subunit
VPHSLAAWVTLDGVADLAPGELRAAAVDGAALVVANCDGNVLAYRDSCKSCGSSLAGGVLTEGVLDCPGCGRRWFLPRAGRSLDDERLQLDPVPLLAGSGNGSEVKVAL